MSLSQTYLSRKQLLVDNLEEQGVTGYSASDGLTTLINAVLEIEGGGGSCYHIEFSEDSYIAVGGTATLEIMLQENYAPKSGATVSITGSDSSSYSCITNSSGVGTVTVSNVASETTFTATFGSVSDTCTVTVGPTYLLQDDASVDNSSTLFGNSIALRNSGSNTVAWSSSGYYTVTNTGSNRESMRVLAPLDGVTDDFILEYDSYIAQSGGSSGFVIYNSSTAWEKLTDDGAYNKAMWYGYNDGTFHEIALYGTQTTDQKWVHYKFTVQGTSFRMEVTYNGDTVMDYSATIHFTRSSSTKYGIDSEWGSNKITRYKNLVAYKI